MSENRTLTAWKRLRIHLREARRTTDSPIVEAQLEAALDAWDDLTPTPLRECPVCGKVGLPERIRNHDCTQSLRQEYRNQAVPNSNTINDGATKPRQDG